jgi:hypothetical protein
VAAPVAAKPDAAPPRGKGVRPPRATPQKVVDVPSDPAAAAGGWRKAKGGLTWVLIGLFFFALMGFVPFAKRVYERSVGDLPSGDGSDWVTIEGYVNGKDKDAVKLSKSELIDLVAFGLPVLLGGFALTIGRLTAGAAPRESGVKGLFAFSGMFTLLAVAGLATYVVCDKFGFREVGGYAWTAFAIGGPLAEFWFLLALGATGGTLKRPKAVRTVGLVGLFIGLGVIAYTIGWDTYAKYAERPRKPDKQEGWLMWEAAAGMLGWLMLIGTYWRAVKSTRLGMTKWLAEYQEQKTVVPAATATA